MIERIVKLEFHDHYKNSFVKLFEMVNKEIEKQEGCMEVNLLRDTTNDNIFFTQSKWVNKDCLEKYRNSILFKETWQTIKPNFSAKPIAWSLVKV